MELRLDHLLAGWSGTDEEGCVLTFERLGEVIYRVKVKSPEYLHLMRLMAYCTYDRTVELLDSHPEVRDWAGLEALLRDQGRERVPEEVLGFYREHWERFQAYLADLEQLAKWAEAGRAAIDTELGGKAGKTAAEYRKAYASRAVGQRGRALLFAALDGKLDVARMRRLFPRPQEAREFLRALREQ